MTPGPRVSVCIPTYNQAQYLGEAIESVLRQSFQDFEIVIVDDASTDDTPAVVRRFDDPRVRYSRQPQNVGIAANRAGCLSRARGSYLAWLDGDDVYYPHMLATQAAVLDDHPRVNLVHGNFHVIDRGGRRLPDWPQPFSRSVIETGHEALRELMVANYLIAPTIMTRRECQLAAGGYSSCLRDSSEDWDMWLRMALRGDVAYTAEPVAQYRQHERSSSATTIASGTRLRADIRVIERLFRQSKLPIPDRERLHHRARSALAFKALLLAGEASMVGRRVHSLALIVTALRLVPRLVAWKESWILLVATAADREYLRYRQARPLLGALHEPLAVSRFGARMEKLAIVDPGWEETLARIAARIQQVVPAGASIAVVDKGDPTILHLSRRHGFHFPDWRRGLDGYPSGSDEACAELQRLRDMGIGYLVFPVSSFWWLDAYPDFHRYLSAIGCTIWDDQICLIYRMSSIKDVYSPRRRGIVHPDREKQAANELL